VVVVPDVHEILGVLVIMGSGFAIDEGGIRNTIICWLCFT
jgi:hypothetical protein